VAQRGSLVTAATNAVVDGADLLAVADRAEAALEPFDPGLVAVVGRVEPGEFGRSRAWWGPVGVLRGGVSYASAGGVLGRC